MIVRRGGHLQRREGFGIYEHQRAAKIFDRRVRRLEGGVEIIIQFAPRGLRAAERFGHNESGGGARANHDDARPRRFRRAHLPAQNDDEQPEDFRGRKEFHSLTGLFQTRSL